ncbi:DUF2080 family transposase-associated protein [Dyadobacter sp. OTU695]|uniref:DUF2080 family transposase-associated protein n=1 Tax=Dyadobacter sp. OTU695 TaxID=3043860 RepID=UPI00313BF18B
MFTKTITPKTTSVTIELPDEYIGKNVKVTASVEVPKNYEKLTLAERLEHIKNTYSKFPRKDLSKLKFDRDEANDFE